MRGGHRVSDRRSYSSNGHTGRSSIRPNSTKGSGVWNWFVFERRYAWMIEMFRTQADDPEIIAKQA